MVAPVHFPVRPGSYSLYNNTSNKAEATKKRNNASKNLKFDNIYFDKEMPISRIAFGSPAEACQAGALKAALAEFISVVIFVFAGEGSGMAFSTYHTLFLYIDKNVIVDFFFFVVFCTYHDWYVFFR